MKSSRHSTPLIVEELEPRILYSADLNPLATELGHALAMQTDVSVTTAPVAASQLVASSQAASASETNDRHEIVFIDNSVAGYEELAKQISAGNSEARSVQVVIIDSTKDGISQISAALIGQKNIDAIHVISHGEPGELEIGASHLNGQSLISHAVAISNWGTALTENGDILLYGCDLAANEAGVNFVTQLGQLTGADVSASSDLTGAKSLGGDWTLECVTGVIESQIALDTAAQAKFDGVLAIFTVTNTNDSGAGSLRQAILDANGNVGGDTVTFSIGAGLATIAPTTALPDITDPLTIDGTTQPGFGVTPIIELNGASVPAAGDDGLRLMAGASGSIVRGLVINEFSHAGIFVAGSNIGIVGNFIGSDATGTIARPNGVEGIFMSFGANNNTIGGLSTAERNVISGNTLYGVRLSGGNFGNSILGNFIGVDASGVVALGNGDTGVLIEGASNNNVIGGAPAGSANIISGNGVFGIVIDGSDNNRILGNFVGTNVVGNGAVANGDVGIVIRNSANTNTIGGASAGERNVIAGNMGDGIIVVGSSDNSIFGNFIGVDATGAGALGNGDAGIWIEFTSNSNIIGGAAAGEGNVISGNANDGININSSDNVVLGNIIGLNAAGNSVINNGLVGIGLYINGANTIGGTAAGARNVISGNTEDGILIDDSDANMILGNIIGLDVTGAIALGNGFDGIHIQNGADNNIIGGAAAGSRNIISGNAAEGIIILGSDANSILGNFIGLNMAGTASVSNGAGGMQLFNSTNNIIGGATIGERNVISGNTDDGIFLDSSTGNFILGNFIGTNAAGTAALGNGVSGIWLDNASINNVIGGAAAGAGNVISGNANDGITISNSSTNSVLGNRIGTNAAGTAAIANGSSGVDVDGSNNNIIGGTAAGSRNIISGNTLFGVIIELGSSGNAVLGNFIGSDAAGTASIANGFSGVGIESGATNNVIGGTAAGERNVLSGNGEFGVRMESATFNTVLGNFIGISATGTGGLANGLGGIALINGADDNIIGGVAAGSINVISGNTNVGVLISNSDSNDILGNFIGVDATGTGALGNVGEGILIESGSGNNIIGGVALGAGNVISANATDGVQIDNSASNTLLGNFIGLDATGVSGIGNAGDGVRIQNAANNNTIGGTTAGSRNFISGNTNSGVAITSGSANNVVLGNTIGIDATGNTAAGNGSDGIVMLNVANNSIGGVAAGSGNVISGNAGNGIAINNSNSIAILGNYVGTDGAASAAMGNAGNGIRLENSTNGVTIGGTTTQARNIISGNGGHGVEIRNSSFNNTVLGNFIGVNVTGASAIGNQNQGVQISSLSSNNTIGGAAAGSLNVISGNLGDGVEISTSSFNAILGNYIGLNASGTGALGNQAHGIELRNSSTSNVIGGAAAGARNVISGNLGSGIHLLLSNDNSIQGNFIGVDALGSAALGNQGDGVYIDDSNNDMLGGVAMNVIAGNGENGVEIQSGDANIVAGNYIGVDSSGLNALGNANHGVLIRSASTNTAIGGATAGSGNVISGNGVNGIEVILSDANRILGNYIGLNATGAGILANQGHGVVIDQANNTVVGGTTAGERNVISGNVRNGIDIRTSNATNVFGNYIGVNALGAAALGNQLDGIRISSSSSNNVIGGVAGAAGNRIAYNLGAGVSINSGVGNAMLGNGIFLNGGLGIDLGANGVMPNDANDADAGANNLQNYAVLAGAATNGAQLSVVGTFNSTASRNFRIEFFASPSADASGFGEGQRYLGFVNVTTDGAGNVTINTSFAATVAAGESVTSTATDLNNNDTSEFGAAVVANTPGINVTPTSGLSTTELGGTAAFQVVLDAIPTSNVTISLASSDTTEGTISTAGLTFTSANWNIPQTVTLTGVQDFVTDGDTMYSAMTGSSVSVDPNYNSVNASDVSLVNREGPNTPPINSAPAGQSTDQATPIVFSVANGNAIAVADADANALQVTLSTTGGDLTLARTTGLVFSAGSGANDSTMTFFGSIANVNAALDGLRFVPTIESGTLATLAVTTDDLGASGSGGAQRTTSNVLITVDTLFGLGASGNTTLIIDSSPPSTAPRTIASTTPGTPADADGGFLSGGAIQQAVTPVSSAPTNGLVDSVLSSNGSQAAGGASSQASASSKSNGGYANAAFRFNDIDQTIQSLLRKVGQGVVVASSLGASDAGGFETGNAIVKDYKFAEFGRLSKESVEVAGAAVSLGAVWFIARSGLLVASLAAGAPAWRRLDPLPILPAVEDERDSNQDRDGRDMADDIFGYDNTISVDDPEEERQ